MEEMRNGRSGPRVMTLPSSTCLLPASLPESIVGLFAISQDYTLFAYIADLLRSTCRALGFVGGDGGMRDEVEYCLGMVVGWGEYC